MHVDIVDRPEALAALREDWEAVYDADPEAHLFTSWIWIERWLQRSSDGWFILAARPDGETARHVAFLPLRMHDRKWQDSWYYNEIQAAGAGYADCTGLLCRPEFEAEALAAFGARLAGQVWARIVLDKLRISDRRLSRWLDHLPANKIETRLVDSYVENGIDLFKCPYADLPQDWETYLTASLSANTRQRARRFLRKVESDESFRITHAGADTIERDLTVLLELWTARWGERKRDRLDRILASSRIMLAHCFEHGALFLPVLWREDRPLAALAILKDTRKRTMHFVMGGRDDAFKALPPAFVLHAHSIRQAIAEGFRTYDFLRGDEPYKYSFATDEYRLRRVIVVTKDRRNLGGKLLPRSLPYVFERSYALHRKGRVREAEIGYRQMLEVNPRSVPALFGLGQIQATGGDHEAAIATFKTVVAIKPTSHKGWFRMGASLTALGQHAEAAKAYAESIRLEPGHLEAHRGLIDALLRTGRLAEVLAAIEAALAARAEQPDPEADWSGILAALRGTARAERGPHAAAFVRLGDGFSRRGALEPAIACYRLALDADAATAGAHCGLGRALRAQGRIDDARESYRRALELEPRNSSVVAELAALPAP